MASLRKRGRNWYYRYVDGNGVKVELRGCAEKRATAEMARAAESRAARVRAGLSDAKSERTASEGRRPVCEHLDDFIGTMQAAGRNAQHVAQTRTYVERLLKMANVERPSDLDPSSVSLALGELRAKGLSPGRSTHTPWPASRSPAGCGVTAGPRTTRWPSSAS